MIENQIVVLKLTDLVAADWNYKSDGTEEQIQTLCNSIKEDKSAGVPAVRHVDDKFEVIDGNHRLEALKRLKWEEVPCENFGDISKATAIVIARRRNYKWFEDDALKLSGLFKNDVLKEYTVDRLEKILPDTRDEIDSLIKLTDFDWDQFNNKGDETDQSSDNIGEQFRMLTIDLPENVFELWQQWKKVCAGQEITSEINVFEYAIVEALNTPKGGPRNEENRTTVKTK